MKRILVCCLLLLLTSCGSTKGLRYSDWQPVNSFGDEPVAIPLQPQVVYEVTPIDGTLKSLLTRWASLTGLRLDYRVNLDWKLHKAAAQVSSPQLPDALSALNQVFAAQNVVLSTQNGAIVVTPAEGTQ